MTPIIPSTTHPKRVSLTEMLPLINPHHGGTPMLVYMARRAMMAKYGHDRAALIKVCGFSAPHKAAAFEWWLLRINDSLPLIGWRIDVTAGQYRLVEISDTHAQRLIERWQRRRG